jgi:hypothetical protein
MPRSKIPSADPVLPRTPRLFTEDEYAAVIRKTVDAVRKARARGQGPRCLRVGGSIRYELQDILTYLEECKQN